MKRILCPLLILAQTCYAQSSSFEPETETARLLAVEGQLVLHRWIGSPVILLLAFLTGVMGTILSAALSRRLPRKGRIGLAILSSLAVLLLLLAAVVMLRQPWNWRMGPSPVVVADGMSADVYHDDNFTHRMDDKGAKGYELVKRSLLDERNTTYAELYICLEALSGPMWRPDRHDEVLVVYHRLLSSQHPVAVRAALTSTYYNDHIHSRQIVSDILRLCDHSDPYIQKFAKTYIHLRFGHWLKLESEYSDTEWMNGSVPLPLTRIAAWWEAHKGDGDVLTKLNFSTGQSWGTAGSEELETQQEAENDAVTHAPSLSR